MKIRDFSGKTAQWLYNNYLIYSYMYYHIGYSPISDHEYDNLCEEIRSRWDDEFEGVDSFNLITKDSINSSSGFSIEERDYPNVVRFICNKDRSWLKDGRGSYLKYLDDKYKELKGN